MEQTTKFLYPQYLREFRCIGNDCEDTCCNGWRVGIDIETYKKYGNIRDDELKQMIGTYVKENNKMVSEEINFAEVEVGDDRVCPFLDESKLCKIQAKLGEEFLSNTCYTYPRTTNVVDDTYECSASVSCPEAARLALLNPEIMEFDETDQPIQGRNLIIARLDTKGESDKNSPVQYFWDLRMFCISLMQNREYSLEDRMIILGLFCKNLEELISQGNHSEIPVLIDEYSNNIEKGKMKKSLEGIRTQYKLQVEVLHKIAGKRYEMGVKSKRFTECVNEFFRGLEFTANSKVEEIASRYEEANSKYFRPFMETHEYILENYIVNQAYKALFPFTIKESVFESYIILAVHYSLIKMYLIGLSALYKGLNIDIAIKLIQSFAKTVDHVPEYMRTVLKTLKEMNYYSMTHMTVIIKN